VKSFTIPQFSVFRIYLGLYLLYIFLDSLEASDAIWSSEGLVPQANLNLTYAVFPGILNYYDSPVQVKIFLYVLSLLAILFTIGIQRRAMAILLWYGWACLLNRNNLVINPSIHYIGWLLLVCAVIPAGEQGSFSKHKTGWSVPVLIEKAAWIFFALGYFLSGIDKLQSPSWMDGSAFKKILDCPLGYQWNHYITQGLPGTFFYLFNWVALGLEMICLPLALFKQTKRWAWCAATLLQAGILLTMNIAPIVFGMLTIHIFLFEAAWFRKSMAK
jgi:hypothetical protein